MEKQSGALLPKIVTLAEKAGKAIMGIYSREDLGTTYKDEGSPLTLADMASHQIILKELKEITPGYPVLSEESESIPYDVRKSWNTYWLIDPLDGTKEFIKRNGEFTVNIALIDSGNAVLGVVHAPALGITYFAAKESGAFKQVDEDCEKKFVIHVSDYHAGRLQVVASRSHGDKTLDSFLQKIGDADLVSMGSSLKLCLVAEGKAHLYPRLAPTMEWDTAAAHCIVESAGGTVTDLHKEALSYNKPDLLNPFFIVSGAPPFPWWEHIDNI